MSLADSTHLEIAHLFPSQDQYYSYVVSEAHIDTFSLLHDLQEHVSSNGPFDALMGFSQGAILAATFLAQRYHVTPTSFSPDIKFAVFFCGGEARGLRDGVAARLSVGLDGAVIDIPTVHIIGKKDTEYVAGIELSQLCKQEQREVLEFDGGHEVPMGRKVVSEMTAAVERVIDRALFRQ